jgi:hypothetical protein
VRQPVPPEHASLGRYRKATIHLGLICLNGLVGMALGIQLELFEAALAARSDDEDLVSRVLEETLDDAGTAEIQIIRYAVPQD